MICQLINYQLSNKRRYCLCDEDLFPEDDCADCEYDESILLTRPAARQRKVLEQDDHNTSSVRKCENLFNKSFLMAYPGNVYPPFNKQYSDWRQRSGGITSGEPKKVVMSTLVAEKKRFLANRLEIKSAYDYSTYVVSGTKGEDEDIVDICLELAYDYDACGYGKFKFDFDHSIFYDHGRLVKGNYSVGSKFVVGEVLDYVTPSREIEGIIDKYVKAIAIVETWQTEENFLENWEENVFNKVGDNSDNRFVYLGWTMNRYLGWNTPNITEQKELEALGKETLCKQFNTVTLSRFWKKAWNTVKALLIMDCLNNWAIDWIRDPIGTKLFDFGFET
jgi:hypothetical protein